MSSRSARPRLEALWAGAAIASLDRIELLLGDAATSDPPLAGLADTDAVAILHEPPGGDVPPTALPAALAASLRKARIADVAEILEDRLAVTVRYGDGGRLRLVPALRSGEEVRMAGPGGTDWFGISPVFFASVLLSENARLEGRLVPVINAAKRVIAELPARSRLGGYHVETLAIAVFRGYTGPRAMDPMLEHFFAAAAAAVLKPLVNGTGQSLHIDDELGPANSATRRRIARSLADAGRGLARAPEIAP